MNDKGEFVEVMADMVDLHQVLFEYGKRYVRAAWFCFENVKYRLPGQDWIPFSAVNASGIIMPLGEHGACSLLYVVEDEYTSLRSARKVMRQEDNFNHELRIGAGQSGSYFFSCCIAASFSART